MRNDSHHSRASLDVVLSVLRQHEVAGIAFDGSRHMSWRITRGEYVLEWGVHREDVFIRIVAKDEANGTIDNYSVMIVRKDEPDVNQWFMFIGTAPQQLSALRLIALKYSHGIDDTTIVTEWIRRLISAFNQLP